MMIRALCVSERSAVTAFMLSLCERDRGRRFCRAMSDDAIRTYVSSIDWDEAVILGAFSENGGLAGLIELCDTGEIAVAVAVEHRENGVARELTLRALREARVLGKDRVMLTCLTENIPMRRLARSVGLTATTLTSEAAGQQASDMPKIGDVVCDNVSYAAALYPPSCTDLVQRVSHAPEIPDRSHQHD